MFEKLFSKKRPENEAEGEDSIAGALAVLLIEAASVDENYDAREKAIIDKYLAANFSLTAEEAAQLRARAETAQSRAHDLQSYTKIAKTMSEEDKIAFVEQLWEIALSDGERDPYEDMLIRRICGLIYVSDPQSGAARARIAAKLGQG